MRLTNGQLEMQGETKLGCKFWTFVDILGLHSLETSYNLRCLFAHVSLLLVYALFSICLIGRPLSTWTPLPTQSNHDAIHLTDTMFSWVGYISSIFKVPIRSCTDLILLTH